MKATQNAAEEPHLTEKENDAAEKKDELLKYRPNPDLLVSKVDINPEVKLTTFIKKKCSSFLLFIWGRVFQWSL